MVNARNIGFQRWEFCPSAQQTRPNETDESGADGDGVRQACGRGGKFYHEEQTHTQNTPDSHRRRAGTDLEAPVVRLLLRGENKETKGKEREKGEKSETFSLQLSCRT